MDVRRYYTRMVIRSMKERKRFFFKTEQAVNYGFYESSFSGSSKGCCQKGICLYCHNSWQPNKHFAAPQSINQQIFQIKNEEAVGKLDGWGAAFIYKVREKCIKQRTKKLLFECLQHRKTFLQKLLFLDSKQQI